MDFTMEGETFARRRDRRVSFAETTAVHVFDRDDSLGTPPMDDSNAMLSPCSDSGGDESSKDTREDGDDYEEEEDGLAVPPVRFPRDMTDSSPGSASAASIASNDGLSLVNNLIFFHTPFLSLYRYCFQSNFAKKKKIFLFSTMLAV
jgi:hypothetical protein